jgi:hypothetical protein
MTGAADELPARQRYEGEVLTGIVALVAGMQRGGRLLDEFPEHGVDASWRSEACAEFRSWRTHLDALPAQAPTAYGEVHTRLLRWATELAAVGDDYATAIAARNLRQLAQANRTMQQVLALYTAMQQALLQVPEVDSA